VTAPAPLSGTETSRPKAPAPAAALPVPGPGGEESPGLPPAPDGAEWPALIQALGLVALTRELANHCVLRHLDEAHCVLALDPQLVHLRSARAEATLEQALQAHFRRPLRLTLRVEAPGRETPSAQRQRQREERQRAAELELARDETVRALQERFDARIVPGSIKPLD